jgi:uncharacterized membrane protein YfcA
MTMKPTPTHAQQRTDHSPHVWRAFLYAIPISILGGLIGLGGAEFRLPVLAGPLNYTLRRAVPLNLAVSLVTLAVSLATRGRALPLETLTPLLPSLGALIVGAVVAAFVGATVATRLSKQQLERLVVIFLIGIGGLLIVESMVPQQSILLIPNIWQVRVGAGVLLGGVIGFVSSVLGVAGGELIIPTLIFVFGVDIKTAGTASLLVSLPTVIIGVARYANRGAFAERQALKYTVVPMAIGSVIGAVIGGLLVGITPTTLLKFGLGTILIVSACRMFLHARQHRVARSREA